jgi:hypothetical protein
MENRDQQHELLEGDHQQMQDGAEEVSAEEAAAHILEVSNGYISCVASLKLSFFIANTIISFPSFHRF